MQIVKFETSCDESKIAFMRLIFYGLLGRQRFRHIWWAAIETYLSPLWCHVELCVHQICISYNDMNSVSTVMW